MVDECESEQWLLFEQGSWFVNFLSKIFREIKNAILQSKTNILERKIKLSRLFIRIGITGYA